MSLMRRNVTKDIWRAVVVAGAMLGSSACVPAARGDQAAEVDEVDEESDDQGDEQATKKKRKKKKVLADAGPPADAAPPAADAAPRPRQEKKEPRGRGFILA